MALKKEEGEVVDGKICEECGNLNVKGRFTCAACGAKLIGQKGEESVAKVKDEGKSDVVDRKAKVENKKVKVEKAVRKERKPRVKKPDVQTRHNVKFRKQTVLVVTCSCGFSKSFGPDKTAAELAEAIENHKR